MSARQLFCETHPDSGSIRCRSGELYPDHPIVYDRGDANKFHADRAASMDIARDWSWNRFDTNTAKTLAPGQYLLAIIREGGYIVCVHSARKGEKGKLRDDFGYIGVHTDATHYLPIEYIEYFSDDDWVEVDPALSHGDYASLNTRSIGTLEYNGPEWFAPIGADTFGQNPAMIFGIIYGIVAVILYCVWNILYFLLQLLAAVASSPLAIMELFG